MKNIDPKKVYSMYGIRQGAWLGKGVATVHLKILRDLLTDNRLKPTLDEDGNIRILGANLATYRKAHKEL